MAGEISGLWPSIVSGLAALGTSIGFLRRGVESVNIELGKKVDKEMCGVRYGELKEDLDEIKVAQTKIVDAQTGMDKTLLLVGERTNIAGKKFDKLEGTLSDWMAANRK